MLVRADFNVPVHNGAVVNDFRIRKTLPVLRFLSGQGARTFVVSHIGENSAATLAPVAQELAKCCSTGFVRDVFSAEGKEAMERIGDGGSILFENIRMFPGEEANDDTFARRLASLADIYVNEAFSTSHREHASIVGVPCHIPAYSGIQFVSEMRHLSLALNPPHPSLVILGGIKFQTKIPLARKFLDIADRVFVGGALANPLFAAEGYQVSASVLPGDQLDVAGLLGHEHLILPQDVAGEGFVKSAEALTKHDIIRDAGPETLENLIRVVRESAFVLWNGPIGDYERGFRERNEALARAIAESSAQSIVGGGDTVASIADLGLEDRFTFVSTAGGAMVQFLSDGTLPGIEALR
ncbi:phosphoglycerate kinase [Candidatus Wolfebacteria bacterium]|nr:phosphoglycerate kinase [Candidatus Wolfebacteria bacterium]